MQHEFSKVGSFESLYQRDPVLVISLVVVVVLLSMIITTFGYIHILQIRRTKQRVKERQKELQFEKKVTLEQELRRQSIIFLKNFSEALPQVVLEPKFIKQEDIEIQVGEEDTDSISPVDPSVPVLKISTDHLVSYMDWLGKAYEKVLAKNIDENKDYYRANRNNYLHSPLPFLPRHSIAADASFDNGPYSGTSEDDHYGEHFRRKSFY